MQPYTAMLSQACFENSQEIEREGHTKLTELTPAKVKHPVFSTFTKNGPASPSHGKITQNREGKRDDEHQVIVLGNKQNGL